MIAGHRGGGGGGLLVNFSIGIIIIVYPNV